MMDDERFEKLKKIRNTTKLAEAILTDLTFSEVFERKQIGNPQIFNVKYYLRYGVLYQNNNYSIPLKVASTSVNNDLNTSCYEFLRNNCFPNLEPSIPYDFSVIDKDLLLKILQTTLNYTDLEISPDGENLELKLPQVSY